MNVGEQIAIRRKEYGYTQEELGEKVGVTDRTIRRIEKRKGPIRHTKTIKNICNVLDIDFDKMVHKQRRINSK